MGRRGLAEMEREPRVPILLYHKVGRPPRGARVPGQYVSPGLFRKHLDYLAKHGYASLSLLDLVQKDRPLPPRPIAITFDDGYRCLYQEAFPLLAEAGFTATVFLVAGALGASNLWEQAVGDVAEQMLDLPEVREMRAGGIEFGSHTLSHAHLTELREEEARREIADSRARLAEALGEPCRTFAYPYGEWNARVKDLVAEAGYEAACTTVRAWASREDDPLALPRINIRRYNVLPRFAQKLRQAERARP